MLEPKLTDIYSQFSSALWKGHMNRIWFQTKDDIIMEPDRIGFNNYKSRNWNPALYRFWSYALRFSYIILNHNNLIVTVCIAFVCQVVHTTFLTFTPTPTHPHPHPLTPYTCPKPTPTHTRPKLTNTLTTPRPPHTHRHPPPHIHTQIFLVSQECLYFFLLHDIFHNWKCSVR